MRDFEGNCTGCGRDDCDSLASCGRCGEDTDCGTHLCHNCRYLDELDDMDY